MADTAWVRSKKLRVATSVIFGVLVVLTVCTIVGVFVWLARSVS